MCLKILFVGDVSSFGKDFDSSAWWETEFCVWRGRSSNASSWTQSLHFEREKTLE